MTTGVTNTTTATAAATATAGTTAATSADQMSQTFLKMLVAQMQNQDPLNPMDNAEVTTQMAQINTVSGINQLNTTMSGLGTSLGQMQLLQGVSLVGHQVLIQGNGLTVNGGTASAGFTLDGNADSVKVNIVSSTGAVVDTVDLGAQTSGEHSFSWTPSASMPTSGVTFQVNASYRGASVNATPMVTDTVTSVSNANNALTLDLMTNGSVPYSSVQAVH